MTTFSRRIKSLENEIERQYQFVTECYKALPEDELNSHMAYYKNMQKRYKRQMGVYYTPKLERIIQEMRR